MKYLKSSIIVIIVLIFFIWLFKFSDYFLFLKLSYKTLLIHYFVSISETILAVIFSIIISLLIFFISLRFSYLRTISLQVLIVFQTIPLIVIAPILLSIFGFSYSVKIGIVALLGVYPILVNIDRSYLDINTDMYLITDLIKKSRIKHVIIPSISTSLFAGIKLTTSYSFASIILTEFIGGRYGLGIYLSRVLKSFNISAIYTIVVICILTTFLLILLVDLLSRLYLKRNYGGLVR